MKDIRTRLLLSAACFFLCLSIAAPVRAGKDAIRPRHDRKPSVWWKTDSFLLLSLRAQRFSS